MGDDDLPVILLTCSGISHTGKLTTLAANELRRRNPQLIARHIRMTGLQRPLEEAVKGEDRIVVVDGCDECCAKKRTCALGIDPTLYVVATREGITKRGMEEARYDEIEALSRAIARRIRE
jgi:uncharacterized metal-binding protein